MIDLSAWIMGDSLMSTPRPRPQKELEQTRSKADLMGCLGRRVAVRSGLLLQ